jgi:hypothetical protein
MEATHWCALFADNEVEIWSGESGGVHNEVSKRIFAAGFLLSP